MSSDNPRNYGVGYGKPPQSGQFRPGKSGNPKGRPKGSLDYKTCVQEMLSRRVAVTEGGQRKYVSVLQATLMRLAEKCLKGDQRALEKTVSLAGEMAAELEAKQEDKTLSQTDEDIIAQFEESLQKIGKTGNHDSDGGGSETDDRN